jgi:hypothetical protein
MYETSIYFNLYKIFLSNGCKQKAKNYIDKAYNIVIKIGKKLSNKEFIKSYFENVYLNREIIKSWKDLNG